MPEEAKFQTSFYADPVDAVFKALGGAMTLTRTNAFDSDGHLRPSQRSELDAFLTVESKNEARFNGDYRTQRVSLEIYDALAQSQRTSQPDATRLDLPGLIRAAVIRRKAGRSRKPQLHELGRLI